MDAYLDRVTGISAQTKSASSRERMRFGFRSYSAAMDDAPQDGLHRKNWYLACPGREIPLRLYRPEAGDDERLPTLIFFHGGGWVQGDLETHDTLAAELAAHAGIQVISVHYRRAPENRHPAAIEDGFEVLRWAIAEAASHAIDPGRIAVGGDSAGGFIAASLCHMARRLGLPAPCFQMLIYPAITPDFSTESYRENAAMPLLKTEDMKRYWSDYLPEGADPLALADMPAAASDLSGLPPALIVAAQYDPLLDDATAYAGRLAGAGVPTRLTVVPGMLHGFLRARSVSPPAEEVFRAVCGVIREAMHATMPTVEEIGGRRR
ncbi:alpha/beta hydrolase [Martelella lutilitoris]|uniref:alpha/beta hydrolase n=1 Tax=Martelella lutilitoris TaxID=2583532 RepID=UPI001AEEC0B5|nr:alpha/beta hydrolase [Martelella lutilitoris]